MIEIETDRLKLIPLDNHLLNIWVENGRIALTNALRLKPCDWFPEPIYDAETEDALQNFWIPQTEANPGNFFWFTNWEIVIINENISIGGIGFGGYPNQGSTGIGYFIDKKFRKNGYATEALNALLNWGFMDPALQMVTADTEKLNLDSQKVLQNNNFHQTGEGLAENTKTFEVYHWALAKPN